MTKSKIILVGAGGHCRSCIDVIEYVERHIDVEFVIKKLEREEIPQYPQEAYREAIINAVMHRDYFDLSEDLVLEVYLNKLIIRNPGKLFGLTVNDLGTKSRIRNTIIADLLLRTPSVEKLGTGFIRMNTAMQKLGLKPVAVCVDDFSFSIELSAEKNHSPDKVTDRLTASQTKILKLAQQNAHITTKELAEDVGISQRKTKENIAKLKVMGLFSRVGNNKTGHWEVSANVLSGKKR